MVLMDNIVKIRISKINCMYQVIDKTFSIKNPPVYFNELSPLHENSKGIDSMIGYIKSKYKNDKLELEFNCISDLEKRAIENGLGV
jgi:hypothetical protein